MAFSQKRTNRIEKKEDIFVILVVYNILAARIALKEEYKKN